MKKLFSVILVLLFATSVGAQTTIDLRALRLGGGGGGTPGGADTSIQFNDGGSFGGFGSWDGSEFTIDASTGSLATRFINTLDAPGSTAFYRLATTGDLADGPVSFLLGVHLGGANEAEFSIALTGDSGDATPTTTFTAPGLMTFAFLGGTLEVGSDDGVYYELRSTNDIDSVGMYATTLTDANTSPASVNLIVHGLEANAAQFSISLAGDSGNATPNTVISTPGDLLVVSNQNFYVFDSVNAVYLLSMTPTTAALNALKTTGAATGKKVVCVDTATGILYTSSTGTDCSN